MAELTPEPGTSEEWKLHKVPQVKPGDAVITASSGRTLQNKEGDLTEVPNGLRVPWFPPPPKVNEPTLEKVWQILEGLELTTEGLREAVFAYNMVEAKGEHDPELHLGTKSGEHLDSLYGPGTGATFIERCDHSARFAAEADVTEYKQPEGPVIVKVVWTHDKGDEIARLRMDMYPDRAHFAHAHYRVAGFHQALLSKSKSESPGGFGGWLRTLGIKVITAQPDNKAAEEALMASGWHWQEFNGQDLFAVRLDQRDRMDEYREWLEVGSDPAQEPEWHKELRLQAKLV